MAELYTYNDVTHLTTVRSDEDGPDVELIQMAEAGAVGSGRVVIENEAGTLDIVGQKNFLVTQSACALTRTFRGFVADREYSRENDPKVSASRLITVSLEDLNSMLGFRGITGSDRKRPAETVAARGAWLMASDYVSGLFIDNGRCNFSASKGMDKADYTDQFPGDVLADMALAQGGVNYHVQDYGSGPELIFRDDNASSADSSSLRISNVSTDKNSVTYHPGMSGTLRRSPGKVKSKLSYQYARGRVVEERTATATAFNGERFGTLSNSHVKTNAKASDEAEAQLWQLHTEEDVIDCSIEPVLDSDVNLIMPGYRVQAKFSHLNTEGYGSFTWFRVLERRVKPLVTEGSLYRLGLRLSPQEAAPAAAAIVQRMNDRTAGGDKDVSFPNPVTIGNLLVYAVGARLTSTPDAPNTSASGARWGAGAWTKLPNVTIDGGRGTGGQGVAIWYKTADSTDQTCNIGETYVNLAAWEISGANIAAAVTDYKTSQPDALAMDIGTLAATSGAVGIMIHLWDQQAKVAPFGTPPWTALPDVEPDSGWTVRRYDSTYESWPILENSPVVAICDGVDSGTGLNPRLTKSFLSEWSDAEWCGAAILIPPL